MFQDKTQFAAVGFVNYCLVTRTSKAKSAPDKGRYR